MQSDRRLPLAGSVYPIVRCTRYEISKLPQQFSLADMARMLRVSRTAVRQWTTTPFLRRAVNNQTFTIEPLKVHRVNWKGRVRVFVLRADLLAWLEETGRLYEPKKGFWVGS